MDPHSRAPKKNTSHGNEVLPQDTTQYLIQRPCWHVTNEEVHANIQQAIRPEEDLLTIVMRCKLQLVWSCLPFIRSGRNHLAGYSERGKKTRQTEEEVGTLHQGMDRPEVRNVPEGSGEQGKWKKLVKSSVVPPTTLAVKG